MEEKSLIENPPKEPNQNVTFEKMALLSKMLNLDYVWKTERKDKNEIVSPRILDETPLPKRLKING